jgi:hypothetical protein
MSPELHIFSVIKNELGREALSLARQLENYTHREACVCEQLFYLHSCIRHNLFPKSTRLNTPVSSENARNIVLRYAKQMRRELVNDAHRRLTAYRQTISSLKLKYSNRFGESTLSMLQETIAYTANKKRASKREQLVSKFNILLSATQAQTVETIHNYSNHTLTTDELAVLQKGLNYNTSNARTTDFIASFEAGLQSTTASDEDKQQARAAVTGMLQRQRRNQPLSRKERVALKTLRNDDSIVIITADKGNAIVILDKTEYKRKAFEVLQAPSTYVQVQQPNDPTKQLRSKVTRYLNTLRKERAITETEWKTIKPDEGPIPRFYGLPKIHKDSIPLRPILSSICSPTHRLAKFLYKLLTPLSKNHPAQLLSSADFLTKVRGLTLDEEDMMVSFDVCALFTNIPNQLALGTLTNILQNDSSWTTNTNLTIDQVVRLTELCLETYLQFDDIVYKQQQGTPMGSPLSGLLAEVVMQHFERQAFQRHSPKIWLRYVDDTFVVIKRSELEEFHQHINSVLPAIQFTREEEMDSQLPFLDVSLRR